MIRILNTYIVLSLCLLTAIQSFGQCNLRETITICDITTIDFDTDGNPDGIINLYDAYFNLTGEQLERGVWNTRSELMFTLEADSGNVFVWDLKESTTDDNLNIYEYELFNPNCGDTPALTLNLIIGAFEGVALPPFGINDVNLEVCDFESIDLFSALVSDATTPPPHLNGVWTYEGGDLETVDIIDGSFPEIEIPYQAGPPIVDEGIFNFKYTVPNTSNCGPSKEIDIKISVVRQVNAGLLHQEGFTVFHICEDELIRGDFDDDINLRDNQYLAGEDIEGFWIQNPSTGGEITDRDDSIVNLKRLYETVISNNRRFFQSSFTFTYRVEKRSGVCSDNDASLIFVFHEALRPFRQNTNDSFVCTNFNSPETVDLFSLIEFTTENDFTYTYPDGTWSFISGAEPIDIDLVEQLNNNNGVLNLITGTGSNARFLTPGVYNFNYQVTNTSEENPCPSQSTTIAIEILAPQYAGEDLTRLEFCETDEEVDLNTLLNVDPEKGQLTTNGTWTDGEGNTINNIFTFPELSSDQQFDFTYTVSLNNNRCEDIANLSFTVINTNEIPVTEHPLRICSDNLNITLFDQLEGNPETTGTWSGPEDYQSVDHLGEFIFNDLTLPRLVEGTYTYIEPGINACNPASITNINIEFVDPVTDLGEPIMQTYCKVETSSVDLLTLLDEGITSSGVFTELDTSGVLSNSTVDFTTLTSGSYNFEYSLPDIAPCAIPILNIEITIIDADLTDPAGENSTARVCTDDLNIILFDALGGSPTTNGTWTGPRGYASSDHLGEFIFNDLTLPRLEAGVYTYTTGDIGPCGSQDSASVTIELIEPLDGQDNDVMATFCKSDNNANLELLLPDTIPTTGIFTEIDSDNALTGNIFNFSDLPVGNYNFEYALPELAPCATSVLTMQIRLQDEITPGNAGTDNEITICSDNLNLTLFNQLQGTPDTTGIWTGPNNYTSANHLGEFIFNDQNLPRLVEGVYTYTIEMPNACSNESQATVTITFETALPDFSSAIEENFCKSEGDINLFELLDQNIPTNGQFTNLDDNTTIANGIILVADIDAGVYNIRYEIEGISVCQSPSLAIELTILDEPVAGSAGENNTIVVCAEEYNLNLFEALEGTPVNTGTWSGPLGFSSDTANALFNVNDNALIPLSDSGTYTYTVGGGSCSTSTDSATVTVQFVNASAIEDDIEQIFCLAENNIDLLDLLNPNTPSNGTFTEIETTGALSGSTVSFASLNPGEYNFAYTLSNDGPCSASMLNIKITLIDENLERFSGEDADVDVCTNNLSLNLFDLLGGNPQPIGVWTGPFGYESNDHLGTFDSTNPNLPRLVEGEYTYTVEGGACSATSDRATITIQFVTPIEVQEDLSITRCKSDISINLFSLLNDATTREGVFSELENNNALDENGRVDFSILQDGVYNFQYTVANEAPCEDAIFNIELRLIELPTPEIPQATFCILDAKRLNDIEVNVLNFNWFSSLTAENPIINNPILVDRENLYLANIDAENCESARIEVPIRILNVGERTEITTADGNTVRLDCPLDFQDGVTPNNDTQNDRFELIKEGFFNIPEAFPDFTLEIYNRFGTMVFKGTRNTEEFKGTNNVNLSLGEELPSGVYFYLFKPNFKNNAPIQGSFYLSK